MTERKKIVIIGGLACGPKAAARARRCDPSAKITIIEQEENLSLATCGFPYFISGAISRANDLIQRKNDHFQDVMGIDVLSSTRAISIDRSAHKVTCTDLKSGRQSDIVYDKLVLATGSIPVVPNLPGVNLPGIFVLKNLDHAKAIHDSLISGKVKNAVVIGAGPLGLEVAEALVTRGVKTTVVEALDWVMPTLLDFEIAAQVGKHLRTKGVDLLFGQRVTGFENDAGGRVSKVITRDSAIEAQLVLLAIGVKPNVTLAKEAGLKTGATGGIEVDAHLRTSDADIFAGGDCVENTNLITGHKVLTPLGSTANKHGRVIGSNVTGGEETFPGVLCTGIAKVFNFNVGRVGLNESQAKAAGFDVVTSLIPGNEYASYYPNGKEILVKVVADKRSGRLLGGQVAGPGDAAKRIDVLATALTFGASVDDLANIDLAYAPPYNSALDPLHNAANVIRNKQSGLAKALSPMEVKELIDKGEDFVFLDVRESAEWKARRIDALQVKLLPASVLRTQLGSLPKNKKIITFCRTSIRAYKAQRTLEGEGFTDVSFVEGSITAWPYDVDESPK
ncbi:MAG: FAD-dependent oxidoreductase [Dehalococcoidales bacterium]|nr:FAD-dependent oxidoreductase [Dehalococcoidales bacterium]